MCCHIVPLCCEALKLSTWRVLDKDAGPWGKLPQVTEIGGYFYDFWQLGLESAAYVSQTSPTSLASYVSTGCQVWLLQSTGRVAPDDVGQLSDGKSELGGERTKLHVVRCKWDKHGCFITPNTVGWISGVNFDPKSPLFTHKAYMRKTSYRRDWH